MIVQAICMNFCLQQSYLCFFLNIALLDDLDKETNNYIMRCKEWYGWHFPELAKIIQDNIAFCKTVQKIG
jgi:RNA processing factor Prp31